MTRGLSALLLFTAATAHAQSSSCIGAKDIAQPQFFDQPDFIVAGVTDNTYRGGHGSDTVLRSSEALASATASLGKEAQQPAGDPLQRIQKLQRAAQQNPTEPNIFDWGTELLAHRAADAAAEVFANGVRRFPKSVRMLLGLASARYAAGLYGPAADCFFAASDIAPHDPAPYLFLGKVQAREILEDSGYEQRMARFVSVLPNNAFANYYYAVALWNRRRGPNDVEAAATARQLLQKAVTLDPQLGVAYLQLGILYVEQHKYQDAVQAYRQAIASEPDLEEAHYRLSEAYRLSGDNAKAQQELTIFREMSKRSAEKLERERRQVQQFVIALRNQKMVQ